MTIEVKHLNYYKIVLGSYVLFGILVGIIFSMGMPLIIPVPEDVHLYFVVASIGAGLVLGLINYIVFCFFFSRFLNLFMDVFHEIKNGHYNVHIPSVKRGMIREFSTGIKMMVQRLEENRQTISHDDLTSLPNRHALQAFISDMKESQKEYYLVFVDLDDFKEINDSFGHVFGDKVLQYVSECLSTQMNESISYRFGGDEFILLTERKPNESGQLEYMCHKLHRLFDEPFTDDEFQLTIHLSIGISHFVFEESLIFEDIIEEADQAMYQDKKGLTPSRVSNI
ncbi:GGDEF domain-containing protein [Jeotgalibacillus salarius]|uniref:GGDEF domain-containing protein n=1 Tax=Jeotgalibacillus salarius TaxID=546023 RepID=A0A4Y8LB28_9BACL|nr:GGDEF domain-containing protein [Jeotgalibacillus salarius]TFD99789.1 GGDEF domain-containing protein [Jeotgalibacillus salarius]